MKFLYPIPLNGRAHRALAYTLYPRSGFTLLELLIAASILLILSTIGALALLNFSDRNKLDLVGKEIESLLRNTQVRAVAQEGGTSWGVYFDNTNNVEPRISVFKGNSYDPQDVVSAKNLDANLQLLNPAGGSSKEIPFSELKGLLVSGSSESITIALRSDANASTTITVFPSGRVERR